MEEEIKILENIKRFVEIEFKHYITDRELQAIENLIKGYRELEERNKQCIKAGDLERAVGFLMNRNDLSNYIPKSKVKEKIEELKGYRDLAKEQIEERVIIADSDSLNYGRAEAHNKDIEVLQKLMEDK